MDRVNLIGTKWRLVSLNGRPVNSGLLITLNFDNDGQASGMAGLFAYTLTFENSIYLPSGDDIRWGIMSSRVGNQSQELESQASGYLDSILWAANYLLVKDRLDIYTAEGDTLIFKPSD